MRISFAKLLLLIAFFIVILVEARTVFAFFGIDVSLIGIAVTGVLVISALVLWAIRPGNDEPTEP
ncbi:CbaC protein [Halobacteria archaeon AArc-curdl1]|uniref:CbaC protein n=1 Tax=Natronosalvus hydrolyticus TaxID=2979988 RepID=A0AAP3E590_9EURY|nr:CbaC protein [Halobacteria archaeon AArc-curdl1]